MGEPSEEWLDSDCPEAKRLKVPGGGTTTRLGGAAPPIPGTHGDVGSQYPHIRAPVWVLGGGSWHPCALVRLWVRVPAPPWPGTLMRGGPASSWPGTVMGGGPGTPMGGGPVPSRAGAPQHHHGWGSQHPHGQAPSWVGVQHHHGWGSQHPCDRVPGQVEEVGAEPQDPVDCRQWTQHHLVAADIRMPPAMALTPPQGEFDSDCMDVNVRGPGGWHPGTGGGPGHCG